MSGEAKKCALQIGINYVGSSHELRGCVNDINDVAVVLRDQYNYTQFTRITDEAATPSELQPTRENILREITQSVRDCRPGDTLFLQYSGHGANVLDTSGDETDGLDEVIISSDMQIISDDELNELFALHLSPGVRVFVLFDACHSGTNLDLPFKVDMQRWFILLNRRAMRLYNRDIVYISGCTDESVASEVLINGRPCGAMTWAFLQTANRSSRITWPWFARRMHWFLERAGLPQKPELNFGRVRSAFQFFSF